VSPRVLALLMIVFTLAPATLTAPVEPARPGKAAGAAHRLIGAWRLAAVEGNSPMRRVQYDHPTGLIVYDRSGWMSVQIAIHGERRPFAAGVSAGTPAEKAEAFDTYLAYYGTYEVDEKAGTVTHHIVDYTNPGFRGRDNVRWFEFEGDNRVKLIPVEDGKGGRINRKDATYKLTWERVEAH